MRILIGYEVYRDDNLGKNQINDDIFAQDLKGFSVIQAIDFRL